MELNPIKRIKLHLELRKNDKIFKNNAVEFKTLSEMFMEVYNNGNCPSDDGTIKALEAIEKKESEIVKENDVLLARDDEIYKELYGGLI